MTKNEPVEELIELTARLIARAHLRRCSTQVNEATEQPDSPTDSVSRNEGDTSSNESESKGENK
ncbi:MAG TPA: hypothetical protein QF564_05225 [Pirellulaceae bacterium]|nr:hypothetical protein [Pirellulaceae bacterium]